MRSRFLVGLIFGAFCCGDAFATPMSLGASPELSGDALKKWCAEFHSEAVKFKWNVDPCDEKVVWKQGGVSVEGRPLVYAEFGDKQATNVSLIFSMVHGDEITPVYIAFQLAQWVKEHENQLQGRKVVIAPLVNPDGFYRKPKTRMNSRGVDVNRNFDTQDWYGGVQKWKVAFHADPRRNPGSGPKSEPETVFQEDLIRAFRPQKIMSIHAPLNHMDYDGPTALSLNKFAREYVHECLRLQHELKAKPMGYFPGSLGNYAGREMGIPTITLELPTTNPAMADSYWQKFREGIHTMIDFSMPVSVVSASPSGKGPS